MNYSHYQCICCGSCVSVCPENAAELRHEIGLKRFFKVLSKHMIRSTELETCVRCGVAVGPKPQIDKIRKYMIEEKIGLESVTLCDRCKKIVAQQSYLFPQSGETFDPRDSQTTANGQNDDF